MRRLLAAAPGDASVPLTNVVKVLIGAGLVKLEADGSWLVRGDDVAFAIQTAFPLTEVDLDGPGAPEKLTPPGTGSGYFVGVRPMGYSSVDSVMTVTLSYLPPGGGTPETVDLPGEWSANMTLQSVPAALWGTPLTPLNPSNSPPPPPAPSADTLPNRLMGLNSLTPNPSTPTGPPPIPMANLAHDPIDQDASDFLPLSSATPAVARQPQASATSLETIASTIATPAVATTRTAVAAALAAFGYDVGPDGPTDRAGGQREPELPGPAPAGRAVGRDVMSTGSIPLGDIQFYDNYVPPLLAGDRYTLAVSQAVTSSQTPTPRRRRRCRRRSRRRRTSGCSAPRFTLPAGAVHAAFPPANASGFFGQNLPHVVLSQRVLPWERTLASGVPANSPWMARLLLTADQIIPPAGTPPGSIANPTLAGTYPVGQVTQPPSGTLGPAVTPDPWDDTTCRAVDLGTATFQAVVPRAADLPYLAHARQVNADAKTTDIAGGNGWFAVVIGNRFPASTAPGGTRQHRAPGLAGGVRAVPRRSAGVAGGHHRGPPRLAGELELHQHPRGRQLRPPDGRPVQPAAPPTVPRRSLRLPVPATPQETGSPAWYASRRCCAATPRWSTTRASATGRSPGITARWSPRRSRHSPGSSPSPARPRPPSTTRRPGHSTCRTPPGSSSGACWRSPAGRRRRARPRARRCGRSWT